MQALRAGVAYFALVFALGFAFGTTRTLLLARFPEISRFAAVLVELPVILTASWLICRRMIRRMAVPGSMRERAVMGAAAFALTMLAEAVLDALLAGATLAGHFAQYFEPSHALGLAGQVAFGLLPLIAGSDAGLSRKRSGR